jgi:tight adherence protein B
MLFRAPGRIAAAVALWAVVVVGAAPAAIAQSPLEEIAEPTGPPIRVTQVETEGDTVILEVEVPPNIAGSKLDTSAVSVVIDGEYRYSEVVRPPAADLAVMLAIDISGSTEGEPLSAAKVAANAFLDSLPEGSLVGLISFGPEAEVLSEPVAEYDAVREAIDSLRSNGATTLFDAVALSAETLSQSPATRRVVVVFSDGADTESSVTLQTARSLAAASDIRVDVVSLQTPNTDGAALAAIAGGDGSVIAVDDPETLIEVFADLGEGLGNQFIVTIPNASSTDITIVVRGDDGVARGQFIIDVGSAEPSATPTDNELPTNRTVVTTPIEIVASPPVVSAPSELMFGERTFTYGVAGVLGGLLFAGIVMSWPTAEAARKKPKAQKPQLQKKRSARDAAQRLTALADAGLARRDRRSKTAKMLEQAGSALRPGEFVIIVVAVTLAALTVGTLTMGFTMGLMIAVAAVVGSRLWLVRRISQVRAAFADQLGTTLQLLASNLRVGHGLLQGVDALARESEQPTAQEFQRVVGEVRLGRDVGEALGAMAERLGNEDFRWVVQAIEIHREVGGDLGEVLDNVGSTIRDRTRLKGQIHALSADGRISAGVMMALPFCVAGLMLATTPDYLDELTGRTGGQILLGFGAVLMIAGGAWLKSIIKLQF